SADIRSDIYALGCTFYHVLAGQAPFPEGDMTARLLKHVEAMPDDVRRFNPKVPPGMVVVLTRMMAKRPEDRYQTPGELLKDLEGSGRRSWMTLAVQGWRAWTAIAADLLVVLGVVLAVTLDLDKDALVQRLPDAGGTPGAEKLKGVSAIRSDEQNIQADANDRLISALDPSKKDVNEALKPHKEAAAKSRLSKQKSLAPPVYQPSAEPLA